MLPHRIEVKHVRNYTCRVGDSNLKAELFADSFDRVFTESEIVSKTRKAIQEATEALALFDTVTE